MKLFIKILLIFIIMFLFVFSIFAENLKIGEWFNDFFLKNGITPDLIPYIVVFILAMAPISELRGSILYGAIMGLDIFWVILLSIIGNILPVFFILYLLGFFEKLLRKIKIFDKFFNWLFNRTMAKSDKVEKYGEVGLMLFVAIPSPLTGAWTGSLVAYLLKLSYLKSLIFIILGVLIACIIVSPIAFIFKTLPTSVKLISVLLIVILLIIYIMINALNKKKENV